MFIIVLIVEPAAGTQRDSANLVVFGDDAEDLSVSRTVIADRTDVFPIDHGRDRAHSVGFIADRNVIFIGEMVFLS